MADSPDIRPMTPSWPARSVIDKQGERGGPRKKKKSEQEEDNQQVDEEGHHPDGNSPEGDGHIDEYA